MKVESVHRDAEHRFSKLQVSQLRLVQGLGVEGDAHAGVLVQHRSRVARDPTRPNLRQVHLIAAELLAELERAGHHVAAGDLGENVTTRGVDLLGLPTGTLMQLGEEALVRVTGLRNPCVQIEAFQVGLLGQVVGRDVDGRLERRGGVMGVVLSSGVVRPGDAITLTLPDRPYLALAPV